MRRVRQLPLASALPSGAFSPDGRVLQPAFDDLQIWSCASPGERWRAFERSHAISGEVTQWYRTKELAPRNGGRFCLTYPPWARDRRGLRRVEVLVRASDGRLGACVTVSSTYLQFLGGPYWCAPMSTREALLEVAARLYADHGWRGATTRRIAEAAGVNEVTIFRQFGSKELLLLEAIQSASRDDSATLPAVPQDLRAELGAWAHSQHHAIRNGAARPDLPRGLADGRN